MLNEPEKFVMFSKNDKPEWFNHLSNKSALQELQQDLYDREWANVEIKGSEVVLTGSEFQIKKAKIFIVE